MRKTTVVKNQDIKRDWYLVDLKDQVLGRAAVFVAELLSGKNKVLKAPNADTGDNVIVINAGQIAITGRKATSKMYYRHSGFPGGFKEITYERQMSKNPEYIFREAVKGMLAKNKMRDVRLARLHVYNDANHNKAAQTPKEVKITK